MRRAGSVSSSVERILICLKVNTLIRIATVEKYLSQFGLIQECKFFTDRKNTKSYGFVLFKEKESLERLISKEVHIVDGHQLFINQVRLKEEIMQEQQELAKKKKVGQKKKKKKRDINEFVKIDEKPKQKHKIKEFTMIGDENNTTPISNQISNSFQIQNSNYKKVENIGFVSAESGCQNPFNPIVTSKSIAHEIPKEADKNINKQISWCQIDEDDQCNDDQLNGMSCLDNSDDEDNFKKPIRYAPEETKSQGDPRNLLQSTSQTVAKSVIALNRELVDNGYEDINVILGAKDLDAASTYPKRDTQDFFMLNPMASTYNRTEEIRFTMDTPIGTTLKNFSKPQKIMTTDFIDLSSSHNGQGLFSHLKREEECRGGSECIPISDDKKHKRDKKKSKLSGFKLL